MTPKMSIYFSVCIWQVAGSVLPDVYLS